LLINKNINKASTLPGIFYSTEEYFNKSKKIFENTWQLITDDSFLQENSTAFPFFYLENFIDEPLVLITNKEKEINCFSNVCTHRGNILVEKPCSLKSNLQCRYHGRKFSLDGKCTFMPKFDDVEGFPAKCDDLTKIPISKWRQFIFCSLNNTNSLNAFFSEMEKRIGWMPIEQFIYSDSLSRDYYVKSNWALYCDNYLEGFHIPFVHEDLSKHFRYNDYSVETFPFSSLQLGVGKDSKNCFDLTQESVDYGKNILAYYFWVFPNMMFNFYPWGLSINIVKPISKDLTKIEFKSYVWDESKLSQGAGSDLDKVEKEDEEIVELVQKGVASRYYDKGRFSPSMEQGVHHFHRLISDFI